MRRLALLLFALPAAAGELEVLSAMRDYYAILGGEARGSIESVRDRIVPNLASCRPDTQKSVRTQIDKGFDPKYGKDASFHAVLAEILAKAGKPGINTLRTRAKASGKRTELRKVIAEALGACGDRDALDVLVDMAYDADPDVARAAVSGCSPHAKVKQDKRKATMRKLIDRYLKVTDATSGKLPESVEMKLHDALAPAMNETLKAFSGGEQLDSAKAWDAWLRENMTKPWTDPQ
ncbi:MAG: HEAT repeat domain-containing protein [Planctomycetota bacterium]